MKLMDDEVRGLLRDHPMGSSDMSIKLEDWIPIVKYFDPCGRYTLFVFEGAPVDEDSDWELFGYCLSPLGEDCDELGYASLNEIQATKNRLGLGMERDLYFTPKPMKELLPGKFGKKEERRDSID